MDDTSLYEAAAAEHQQFEAAGRWEGQGVGGYREKLAAAHRRIAESAVQKVNAPSDEARSASDETARIAYATGVKGLEPIVARLIAVEAQLRELVARINELEATSEKAAPHLKARETR